MGIQQVIKVCWEKSIFPSHLLRVPGAPACLWAMMYITGRRKWRMRVVWTIAAFPKNLGPLNVVLGIILKKKRKGKSVV